MVRDEENLQIYSFGRCGGIAPLHIVSPHAGTRGQCKECEFNCGIRKKIIYIGILSVKLDAKDIRPF